MFHQIFSGILAVFNFCFGALRTVWDSIDPNWFYAFLGIFATYTVFRFFLIPILGRQSFVLPSGWNVDKPEEPKERYQNTGIGFTARW